MATPFNFSEQKHSFFNHAIRVFIFGEDVTPWVTGDLSISYADRSGTNLCSFTLTNQMEAFSLTATNLNTNLSLPNRFRAGDPYAFSGMYSELAKRNIYKRKTAQQINHVVSTFGPVQGVNNPVGQSGIIQGSRRDASQAASTTTQRYPFNLGSLIFHKYDTVRVFVLNPLIQPGTISEAGGAAGQQWWCAFAGYIDTKPYTVDYVNGLSLINITCQDIRVLMQAMRTQTNPGVSQANNNAISFNGNNPVPDSTDAGYFNDLVSPTNNISHVLGGRTFQQSIDFLLLGINAGQPSTLAGTTTRTNVGGVCQISKGATLNFDPTSASKRDLLENWNNLVLFGFSGDFNFSKTNGSGLAAGFLSFADMLSMGANSAPGGESSPDNAWIHYLYPSSGAPPATLVQYSQDAAINQVADWSTRLELISQVVKSVDYQFYVSPIGDIILEFPMYDFFPNDFGTSYNSLYSFFSHAVSDTINDEGGEPISALVVNSHSLSAEVAQGNPQTAGAGFPTNLELTSTIFSNVMASRIGPHVETYSVPGVGDQNRLAQLGMMEFAKRIANFDQFEMNTSFRPFILPNRPIFNQVKQRIGILTATRYNWKIREEASLALSLSYARRLEADGTFRFITGGEAVPISYSTIYDPAQVFVPGMGINTDKPVTGTPTVTPPAGNS
jgi:hypothetical protein